MENKCRCAGAMGKDMQRIEGYSCAIPGCSHSKPRTIRVCKEKHGQLASF